MRWRKAPAQKAIAHWRFRNSIKDATAAPQHPKLGDGYKAALINFGYISNAVLSTDEVVAAIE